MDGELDQLGERIAEQAAHLDAAKHRLLTDLREFDARGGWLVQGAATCAHWLAWRIGWDLVTARDHLRVARKLPEFALVDDALRRGELSYSKVRALLRVATSANEALLLDHARLMTASQLESLCRQYALVQRHGKDDQPQVDEQRRHVRRRDLEDGMVKIEAVLHPEEAELVWTMLDHAASRLAREAAAAPQDAANRSSAESRGATPGDGPGSESRSAAPDGRPPGSPGAPDSPSHALEGTPHPFRDVLVPHEPIARGAVDAAAEAAPSADSAESTIDAHMDGLANAAPAQRASSRCAAILSRSSPDVHEVDDSAELQADAEAWAHTEWPQPAHVGDLAAIPGERSLLDRLLDEADALRGAKADATDAADVAHAARSDELAPAPHPARAGQGPRQPTGRDTSVLRDRAAVARTAFNHADALVELAQGYLRGDRPDRPPTTPGSSDTWPLPRGWHDRCACRCPFREHR